MLGGTVKEGGDAEQQLLARVLGALIALRRFDSPIYLARAVHGATLALSLYAEDLRSIKEADRDWLIAAMPSSSCWRACSGKREKWR
jgi:hypothetical protein